MKTEDLIAAETARRAKLAEAANKRQRERGRFVAEPPPMRAETNGLFGLQTDDAPRPWLLTAAWLLLGFAVGWAACAIVGAV